MCERKIHRFSEISTRPNAGFRDTGHLIFSRNYRRSVCAVRMKLTLGMIWMKWKMGMAWMKLTVLAEFVAPNLGHGRLALSREGGGAAARNFGGCSVKLSFTANRAAEPSNPGTDESQAEPQTSTPCSLTSATVSCCSQNRLVLNSDYSKRCPWNKDADLDFTSSACVMTGYGSELSARDVRRLWTLRDSAGFLS